jgi:hypothetical protein
MSQGGALEPERILVKRYIHENGGRDATALSSHDKANVLVAHYRDPSGRRCVISITIANEDMDLEAAVREAMRQPTVIR